MIIPVPAKRTSIKTRKKQTLTVFNRTFEARQPENRLTQQARFQNGLWITDYFS
jgi:hypothetical protein